MSFKVYSISKIDIHGNSHFINRDESWSIREIASFTDEEYARSYVRERAWPEVGQFLADVPKHKWDKIIDEFCFNDSDDHYIIQRRVFLGKPDTNAILRALKNNGVRVVTY